MKRLLFTFCFLVSVLVSSGQSASPFRQFFFNPYLYNPGFVGVNGTSEVYLAYRKQWVNFNDGPTTMGVSLQYPTHKRVALGLNVTADEVVALRNTTALLTFAYVLPIADEQTLRFGISGGFGNNNLNLKEGEYDPNDPVIINAAQNNFYADGNFGAVYTFKGLRVGFSLPQIFKTNRFTSKDFSEVEVSPTDNQFYSVSYKFPIGTGSIALEPYVLYNNRADGQNSWEAASLVHIKENLWAGASYHQTNGLGFFFGMNVKSLLRFSYSYELPPVSSTFVNSSSHELQLSLRLSKKRDPIITKRAAKTQQQSLAQEEKSETKEEPVVEEDTSKDTRTANTQNSIDNAINEPVVAENTEHQIQPNNTTSKTTTDTSTNPADNTVSAASEVTEVKTIKKTSKPPMSFTLARGHYVVVGAFKIMDNALKYSMEFQRKGVADPMVAISPKNGLYYVYIFSSYDLEETRKERNQYRLRRLFSEAWVLTID